MSTFALIIQIHIAVLLMGLQKMKFMPVAPVPLNSVESPDLKKSKYHFRNTITQFLGIFQKSGIASLRTSKNEIHPCGSCIIEFNLIDFG